MKPSLTFIGVLALAFAIAIGCYVYHVNHEAKFFVQGNIQIAFPVTMPVDKYGAITQRRFNDGGTKMIKVFDANGTSFDVYIDHRINHKKNWGAIYLNDYPDSPHSIRIIDQANFRKKIITPLNISE